MRRQDLQFFGSPHNKIFAVEIPSASQSHRQPTRLLDREGLAGAMESLDAYEKMLASLSTLPPKEAEDVLLGAMLKGGSDGIGLSRAGVSAFTEHAHHYLGCPNCDKRKPIHEDEDIDENLLQTVDSIRDSSEYPRTVIHNCWLDLVKMMRYHEPLVRKRWIKRTPKQRRAILESWPGGMPTYHGSDFEPTLQTRQPFAHLDRNLIPFQRVFALPHINLEDLTGPKNLLLFLNARGRHPPATFAHSDLEQATLYKLRPEVLARRPSRYTMMFNAETDLTEYGSLIEWSDETEAKESILKGHTVHPNHGFQILSIQAYVLSFLVHCCRCILHDLADEELLPSTDMSSQPEPPFLTDDGGTYGSLSKVIREVPYRVPANLDLARVQALILAQKDQAADHVWSLREDPSYFDDVTGENLAHRPELLPGQCCGMPHENVTSGFPGRVMRDMIIDAYVDLYDWDQIDQRFDRLQCLISQIEGVPHPKKPLPEQLFESFVELRFYLEHKMIDLITQTLRGYPASPSFSEYFVRRCDEMRYNEDQVRIRQTEWPEDETKARVMFIFRMLADSVFRETLTVHGLMDVLDKLLGPQPVADSIISQWIATYLSQLSLVSECLQQLHLFQPWAKQIEHAVETRRKILLARYLEDRIQWKIIFDVSLANVDDFLIKSTEVFKAEYPVHRRHTRDVVLKLRKAEFALDAFWRALDGFYQARVNTTPHELVKHILQGRVLHRTPPWVEMQRSLKSGRLRVMEPGASLPAFQHDPNKQITGNFSRLSLIEKPKLKTRGETQASSEPSSDPAFKPTEDIQPIFRLNRRAYKVFKTLFHVPNDADAPGEIPWSDFLYAMAATGFGVEKLSSSAWQFTPTKLDVERPIQFHEPHPSSKLPFTWARRFGRRLTRTYGWKGDMFRLA